MALIPSQILRVAILLSYFSILCNYKAIDMPAHQTYGGSWKFLTFIDLVIQAVFFGVCVLTDLSSLLTKGSASMEQERQLKKLIGLRDWMMAVLAFPVGVFVVTMFWALYLYDRDLVYPRLLDNFIPQWLNHGMVSGQLLFSPLFFSRKYKNVYIIHSQTGTKEKAHLVFYNLLGHIDIRCENGSCCAIVHFSQLEQKL
ncbi:hypothetical protein PO909_010353 [Leuciscus waleckii]